MRFSAVFVITSEPPCVMRIPGDKCHVASHTSAQLCLLDTEADDALLDYGSESTRHLKQQGNAVGKAVDVDARPDVAAAQADGRLDDERVPFQHSHVACSSQGRNGQWRTAKSSDAFCKQSFVPASVVHGVEMDGASP